MSDLKPDPVHDKLARFTPNPAFPDPAEVLFFAGRASARTSWGWKATVVGLLFANVVQVGILLFREAKHAWASTPGLEQIDPVVNVGPMATPTSEPRLSPGEADSASPWSFGVLHRVSDPNDLPQAQAVEGLSSGDPPLTPRSRGEIN